MTLLSSTIQETGKKKILISSNENHNYQEISVHTSLNKMEGAAQQKSSGCHTSAICCKAGFWCTKQVWGSEELFKHAKASMSRERLLNTEISLKKLVILKWCLWAPGFRAQMCQNMVLALHTLTSEEDVYLSDPIDVEQGAALQSSLFWEILHWEIFCLIF